MTHDNIPRTPEAHSDLSTYTPRRRSAGIDWLRLSAWLVLTAASWGAVAALAGWML